MTTWLDELAQYLEDSTASIGVFTPSSTQTRDIFIQNAPSTLGSYVVLYPYAGMKSDWTMNRDTVQKPRLNILVTSTAADGGHQKSIDIRTRLDHVSHTGLPTSTIARYYLLIESLGEPEYLGKDSNGRGQFVQNFQIQYITTT
jgi:hypothetical protein